MTAESKRSKSKAEIARNMGAIRSTGNKTEVALRSHLHRLGLRFRKNVKSLPGRPDIVFATARVAVFVDGDYWHGRMLREKGSEYVSQYFQEHQRSYWTDKLARNVARDRSVNTKLENAGWLVMRYWESEVKRNMEATAVEIHTVVKSRQARRGRQI